MYDVYRVIHKVWQIFKPAIDLCLQTPEKIVKMFHSENKKNYPIWKTFSSRWRSCSCEWINDTQKITKISSGNKLGRVSDVKAKVFIKHKSHSQKFFKMVAFVINPEWIKQEITHFIKSFEHLTNYSWNILTHVKFTLQEISDLTTLSLRSYIRSKNFFQ